MGNLVRAVKWPIISWVVVDVVFVAAGFVGGVLELYTPAGFAPLLIAFGFWAGYKMIEFGGNYGNAIVAGVIVGAACAILTIVGFVLILGQEFSGIFPLAVYSLAFNIAGALVGGGFALTK